VTEIPDEWLRGLRTWACRNDSVRELWLFGSYAKGCASPESDVDISLTLMPADGKHNWAEGNYYALHSEWKKQLEAIVDRHVSLVDGLPPEVPCRLLWARS
jgi:predicted nucleotidyltransferase